MITRGFIVSVVACACVATVTSGAQAAPETQNWQRVGTGITGGVSGMAQVQGSPQGEGRADLVVVRDNKEDGQERLATVRLRPHQPAVTKSLKWVGALPVDLEALDAVPGRRGHYIALASAGTAYHVAVKGDTATVQGKPVPLPKKKDGDNYESFALQRERSGATVAVWATRGKNEEKSVVRTAPISIGREEIRIGACADSAQFSVPFPDEDEVRHISDLKVLPDSTVLVSAASDPNIDDGPFGSAVYDAGKLTVDRRGVPSLKLKKHGLSPLRKFTKQDDRKIEAIVQLNHGRAVWGTDDENNGGSVLMDHDGRR